MGKKRKKLECPECIEAGCTNRTRPRQNWHTMNDDIAMEADPWHHRCSPCYAKRLAGENGRSVKARKQHECCGCERAIRPGENYQACLRPSGRPYPERVAVCLKCAGNGGRKELAMIDRPSFAFVEGRNLR